MHEYIQGQAAKTIVILRHEVGARGGRWRTQVYRNESALRAPKHKKERK